MTRIRIGALGFGLFFLVFGCGGGGSEDSGPLPIELTENASQQIDAFLKVGLAPGAIVSVSTPEGTWTKAFGVADTATDEPMRADMNFRIGSVTKTFTTTLVLMLAQEGKLGLDDPIGDYLEGVPRGDEVTIRQMASMRSGIPSYSKNPNFIQQILADWYKVWLPTELPPYGYALDFKFDPGTDFEYSNTNTVLLGLLVEKLENKPLGQVMQERIYSPLGLSRTYWPAASELHAPYSHGYSDQNLQNVVEDATGYSPSWGWAAGAMTSTISDLNVWATSLATGSLISSAMQQERLSWTEVGPMSPIKHYAFGIVYISGWLGHTGELPGYNTAMYYNPSLQSSIVVIANTDVDFQHRAPAVVLLERLSEIFFPANRIDYENPVDPDDNE